MFEQFRHKVDKTSRKFQDSLYNNFTNPYLTMYRNSKTVEKYKDLGKYSLQEIGRWYNHAAHSAPHRPQLELNSKSDVSPGGFLRIKPSVVKNEGTHVMRRRMYPNNPRLNTQERQAREEVRVKDNEKLIEAQRARSQYLKDKFRTKEQQKKFSKNRDKPISGTKGYKPKVLSKIKKSPEGQRLVKNMKELFDKHIVNNTPEPGKLWGKKDRSLRAQGDPRVQFAKSILSNPKATFTKGFTVGRLSPRNYAPSPYSGLPESNLVTRITEMSNKAKAFFSGTYSDRGDQATQLDRNLSNSADGLNQKFRGFSKREELQGPTQDGSVLEGRYTRRTGVSSGFTPDHRGIGDMHARAPLREALQRLGDRFRPKADDYNGSYLQSRLDRREKLRQNLYDKSLKTYLEAERNEAAKYVRYAGDNVDPHHVSRTNRQVNTLRELQETAQILEKEKPISQRILENNQRIDTERAELLKPYATDGERFNPNNIDRTALPQDVQEKLHNLDTESTRVTREYMRYQRIMDGTFGKINPNQVFEHAKTYTPSEGITGFGLGYANYMKASRTELLHRAVSFSNPLSASSREAVMNTFGILTNKQSAVLNKTKTLSYFSRLMTPGYQMVAGAYISAGFTALSGGDPSDFITNQLSFAAGLQGWRIGASIGGAMVRPNLQRTNIVNIGGTFGTLAKANTLRTVGRGVLGVAGGLTGFGLGMLAVQKGADIIQDLTSNTSSVRQLAKDLGSRSVNMNLSQNRATLTSRQAALEKLAKSGLNDRSILMGNEARVLKGLR